MLRIVVITLALFTQACSSWRGLPTLNVPDRHSCVSGFASGGKIVYLTRSSADFAQSEVLQAERTGFGWSRPERLPFVAGRDSGSALSPDGLRLIFTSRRKAEAFPDQWNLWTTSRANGSWTAAEVLPEPINSRDAECCAVFGPAGEIYFSSTRGGSWDIHIATPAATVRVERLDPQINRGVPGPPDESGRNGEWPRYADPRGRFLLFSSIRPGGLGGDDIYVAVRDGDGWQPAANLGALVNTAGYEDCATITPDGRYLVWSSRAMTKGATSQIRMLPVRSLDVLASGARKPGR